MTRPIDHIRKSPHRNRLENHVSIVLPTLNGPILDIGSRNRRYDHLLKEEPTAIDIVENKQKKVVYGDVTKLSFSDSSFQSVICLEVLEYISEPQRALDEVYRVLGKGGVLVLSVPFMFKVHEDKLRYTAPYLRELLNKFEILEFDIVGGSYIVILTIIWNKIKKIRFTSLRYCCLVLLLPLFLCIRKTKISDTEYASGYIVVAKKNI